MQELTELDIDDPLPPTPAPPAPSPVADGLAVGDRVVVTRHDTFYGRHGTIISAHGHKFWNICLDRLPKEPGSHIIYKTETGLRKLPPSGQGGVIGLDSRLYHEAVETPLFGHIICLRVIDF